MSKNSIENIKQGDIIKYKFTESGVPKTAKVAHRNRDGSGVYIYGIIEDSFFYIDSSEIVEVIEADEKG